METPRRLKPEYDDEPVYYCTHCLSLNIKDAGLPDLLFCDECGNANIETTTIDKWEDMYENKYGFKYLNN
jgi:Fe2+ or Zn2+ uptake regulation protein